MHKLSTVRLHSPDSSSTL